ncbi:hypothetical protein JOY44_02675 [Phormidium sp. CLA17]|uniref:hypothetical protein n=1 Tax=Leptolyngbya sp. Cla-17 TaxID=2803751 RepID=UPI001490FDA2|nr:hypothetical protein [Leptolyngbya sp. Cla-17]MBM0740531.1 hypothetical protein [Leptolyngbya sp. Cla-17]
MALRDSWQSERLQRQQSHLDRQHQVQQFLSEAHQSRQLTASRCHSSLSLFREGLMQQNEERRSEFQIFQATLQDFHTELQATVSLLRQSFQVDLSDLSASTQVFLAQCQQERIQNQQALRQELGTFIETLRSDVQSYLSELETLRLHQADLLRQNLQQNRAALTADNQTFFAQLAPFREELRHFHQSLQSSVWGQASSDECVIESAPEVIPTAIINTAIPLEVAASTPEAIAAKPSATMTTTKAPAKRVAFPRTRAAASAPAKSPKVFSKTKESTEAANSEKAVYNFLHKSQGARLTQIESSLQINRFQAVDALRSLIKKGLITQRDRIYLIQEDLVQK